jgi:cell wall assembly regulator SMI1
MLTLAQLAEYADVMRECGVPFDKRIAPGLSQDEIDATTQPQGLTLPDEARLWWSWRNGQIDGGWGLFPSFRPASLFEAVKHYHFMRMIAANIAEPGLEGRETANQLYAPEWFPLDAEKSTTVVDCSVPPGQPTPIRRVSFEGQTEEYWPPRARSLGEAVQWWTNAMNTGAVVWRADEQLWRQGDVRWADVPGYNLL